MNHPKILETHAWHWPDEAACAAFAQRLAGRPEVAEAVLELEGPLGAGKTTFARHLLRALGVAGRIKSPTYAVMESYAAHLPATGQPLAVAHFDFYRFADPREWEDAGFRDVFAAPGLKLCEWAQQVRSQLPLPDVRLCIAPDLDDEQARNVTALAFTPRGVAWLA